MKTAKQISLLKSINSDLKQAFKHLSKAGMNCDFLGLHKTKHEIDSVTDDLFKSVDVINKTLLQK